MQTFRQLIFFVALSLFAHRTLAETPVNPAPLDEQPQSLSATQPSSMPSLAVNLPRPVYQIDATLSKDQTSISGAVTISFENVSTSPISEALLMLYPNRFEARPSYMNEVNQPQHYPGNFSPAEMKISELAVAGSPATFSFEKGAEGEKLFAKVALPKALQPGEKTSLSMEFTTTIPERYGRFGRAEGAIVLDGGFYPQLAYLNQVGFSKNKPPRPGALSVKISAPSYDGSFWVNGQGPFTAKESASLQLESGPYASVIFLKTFYQREDALTPKEAQNTGLVVANEGAPRVTYFYTDKLSRHNDDWDESIPGLNTNAKRDYPGEVNTATLEGIEFLEGLGYSLKGSRFVLIEIPLREYVARAAPGVILISDRAMKIFPSEKILKFHKLQILRALYNQIVEQRAVGFEQEEDLPWVADALGAYLSDLYHLKGFLKQDFAKEMLKPLSFISEIDRLRWVPQVSFKDAYFKTAYEADLFKDDVRRFPQTWPYGKFIYGKLRALLGFDKFVSLARTYLSGEQRTTFRALSEIYYEQPLGWFYQQWMGPHPQINYKLVSYQSTQKGNSYENEVKVAKEGQTWVREPIDVLITYQNKTQKYLRWPLEQVEYTFSWRSTSPIQSVHIDPAENTLEVIRGIPDDLKLDNLTPKQWRVVWEGIGADASANGLILATSGSARAAHDKRNFYFLSTSVGSGRLAGFDTENIRLNDFGSATTGYSRAFGLGLDEDRLTARVGTTLTGAYLGPFVSDQNQDDVLEFVPPAFFTRVVFSGVYSDRLAFLNPWKGSSVGVSVSYSVGSSFEQTPPVFEGQQLELRDNCTTANGLCQTVTFSAAGSRLFSLDGGKVFGVRLAGATLVGTPLGQGFFDLGGSGNLKGYPINEIEGRARVLGSLEYRHPFWQHSDVNLAEVLRVRSVYGIFWVDGATISDADPARTADGRNLFGSNSLFADAGFGLRLTGDYAGVDPSLLSLDVATPLVGSQVFNPANPFPPIQFYLGFEQNF